MRIQIKGIRLVKNKRLNELNMSVNVGVVFKAFQKNSLDVGVEVGNTRTNGLNLCAIHLHKRCNFFRNEVSNPHLKQNKCTK